MPVRVNLQRCSILGVLGFLLFAAGHARAVLLEKSSTVEMRMGRPSEARLVGPFLRYTYRKGMIIYEVDFISGFSQRECITFCDGSRPPDDTIAALLQTNCRTDDVWREDRLPAPRDPASIAWVQNGRLAILEHFKQGWVLSFETKAGIEAGGAYARKQEGKPTSHADPTRVKSAALDSKVPRSN